MQEVDISIIRGVKAYLGKSPHIWGGLYRHLMNFKYRRLHEILEKRRSQAIAKHGFEALKKFHQICINNNISYWLYAGTLLGMIRDKDLIHSDTDIDIGMWQSDEVRIKLEEVLHEHDYKKLYEFSVSGNIREQRFEYKGVGIDIYYFRHEGDFSYASVFNTKDNKLYLIHERYRKSAFDKITNINVNDVTLSIPQDYIHILEQLYGDWQTPIAKEDGYVMFSNPNQVHHYEIEAQFTHYAESVHK